MSGSAKRVRVSDDDGVTWYTLPGNTADFQHTAEGLSDTIFGQSFSSEEIGLINWNLSGNALFKGFAGYVATILQTGSATPTTAEAFTLVSGKTYQVNAATRRIWDRSATTTIYDNAAPVANADIESIDYLFGRVTFAASYTPTTPITADFDYFATAAVGRANSFTLTQTAEAIDQTDMQTAQANGGYRSFCPGLRTVSLELSGIYDIANGFIDALETRGEVIIQLNPDGNDESVMRGFFKLREQSQSGDVGALEEESVTFVLNVPEDTPEVEIPLKWVHTATTLGLGVQVLLASWEGQTEIDMQYLADGTNGKEGNCIVTEVSLAGGLDAMNEFSVSLQGTGATVDVP